MRARVDKMSQAFSACVLVALVAGLGVDWISPSVNVPGLLAILLPAVLIFFGAWLCLKAHFDLRRAGTTERYLPVEGRVLRPYVHTYRT